MRPLAAPFHFAASANDSAMLSAVPSRSPSGHDGSSIMHLPATARMPPLCSASKMASVWCTVPMSTMAVVPPSNISAMPSSADAAKLAYVCAASSGQMRSFNHSNNARSSARFRNNVWHRWMCVCTKPGNTTAPLASRTLSPSSTPTSPTATMRPSAMRTSARTTLLASSMVITTPPRITKPLMVVALGPQPKAIRRGPHLDRRTAARHA